MNRVTPESYYRTMILKTQIPLLIAVTSFVSAKVDFAHEVLPILKENCAKCHTNGKYKGGLSLDTREALLESDVIELGDSQNSLFIKVLTAHDEEDRMPQDAEPLLKGDIAILARWVNEGLAWEKGFTFKNRTWKAPLGHQRVELPGPEGGNPIDRIAADYFKRNRIQSPAAISDARFLRRVSLDLVGLLPLKSELETFVASDLGAKREAKIKQILTRDLDYADHWMTFWNDLLRNDYAGTGFIDGGRRQITGWLYLSLRENKPYDQFVRELLNPTAESEGFIKGIKWRGNVNASQVPEIQFAQNVSQLFFGENMKCASCHDSFINNWKLEDAYGMAAIIAGKPLEMYRCDKPTGKKMGAKFLFDELGSIDKTSSRNDRLKRVAELATAPGNGRLARTIVNRLWARLMGRGLVEPVDIMSNRPWSEDMLNYLAWDLSQNAYDLKRTLSIIVSSRTYQSATVIAAKSGEDFVFEGPSAKRMTAEQFMDAVWEITETAPDKIDAKVDRGSEKARSVRASLVKSTLLMRALGRPNREQVVTTRPAELTTLQALELNNGKEFVNYLNRGATKLFAEKEMVENLYLEALSRLPSSLEKQVALKILGEGVTPESTADLLWTILMLPEFQFIN